MLLWESSLFHKLEEKRFFSRQELECWFCCKSDTANDQYEMLFLYVTYSSDQPALAIFILFFLIVLFLFYLFDFYLFIYSFIYLFHASLVFK